MNTIALKERMNLKIQNLKSEKQEEKSQIIENTTKIEIQEERNLTMETTALTTATTEYVAFKNNALELINENLKNQPMSLQLFDIVKSPSGGATVFSVPSLTGEDAEKELTGIILNYTMPRAYWDTSDPIEGTPPVCFSPDSLISHEGKSCSHCEFNTLGSRNGGETAAKACKESVAILLLRPNNIIPIIVRVPVTSKMLFLKYTTRLLGSMTALSGVVTKITLDKATSKQGKPFALYNFETVNSLTPEEAASAKEFSRKFMELLKSADSEPVIAEAG